MEELEKLKDAYEDAEHHPWPAPLKSETHTSIASLTASTGLDPKRVAHLQVGGKGPCYV